MYDIVYIDCAWPYTGSQTKDAAAGKHYNLMSWQDLENMPILDLCNKKAYILMWATCPLLNKQVDVMES